LIYKYQRKFSGINLSKFIKQNKKLFIATILCAVVFGVFLLFGIPQKASAQSTQVSCTNFGAVCNGCANAKTFGSPCVVGTTQGVCSRITSGIGEVFSGTKYGCYEKRTNGNTTTVVYPDGTPVPKEQYSPNNSKSLWEKIIGAPLNAIANVSFYLVTKVISAIVFIVWAVFGFIMQLGAWFLEAVITSISFSTFTKSEIVKTGWTITRDIANMFFVLAMMVMAFATILQIESYNWKRILPKLIIAALLINFSLVIAGVIIDFSQVTTKYFFNASTGQGLVSDIVMSKLNIHSRAGDTVTINNLFEGDTQTNDNRMNGIYNAFIMAIPQALLGILVFLMAAIVFFAGGFFLIVRTIALWFLLIFAPLIWAFYILPVTKKYWDMWWQSFTKWIIFAPAYAFLLWLSIKIIQSDTLIRDAGMMNVSPDQFNNANQVFKLHYFMDYIIILGLLYGSLYIAQKSGVVGANAVVGMVKGAGKSIGMYAARKGTGYDRWAPAATERAGRILRNLGLTKAGGIVVGRAQQMREKELERPENKAYDSYLKTLSPLELQRELATSRGAQNAALVAQAMKETGALERMTSDVITRVTTILRSYGRVKEATELEEIRPESILDPVARNAASQRAMLNGAYKKWATEVFQSPFGPEFFATLQAQLPVNDFINFYKGLSTRGKQDARIAMEANFTDGPQSFNPGTANGQDNLRARNLYAAATGNVNTAFHVPPVSGNAAAASNIARTHVESMTPTQIGTISAVTIDDQENLRQVGRYITLRQVRQVRGEVSDTQKQYIMDGIARYQPNMAYDIAMNPVLAPNWT